MRPCALLATALALVPGVLGVDQSKSAIVWFDDPSTPDSVINEAKDSILKAGGKITHEYTIIKCVFHSHEYPSSFVTEGMSHVHMLTYFLQGLRGSGTCGRARD